MKTIKILISLALITFLSACSSTQEFTHQNYPADKKPLTNDTQLLISLLKRPTTADQIMMTQFAASQAQYFEQPLVNYVSIKGEKTISKTNDNTMLPKHHLDVLYSDLEAKLALVSAPY